MQWPMLQLLWWGSTAQAEAPCSDGQIPLAIIEEMTADATQAFTAQDLSGLHQGRDDSLAAIPCLGEPITPDAAAAFHRMLALGAFTEGDRERSQAELQAARALQPAVNHLDGLVLPGHPLTRLYDETLTSPPPGVSIEAARGSDLLIDGRDVRHLPTGAAAVVQYLHDDAVSQTLLFQPGDPLPVPSAAPTVARSATSHRPLLLAATGTTAIAAAVVYGLSWQAHSQLWDTEVDPIPDGELAAQQQRTNRRASAAAILGAGAGVMGTLTIVYW
ncbi:MAG: hypothetical protein ACI8RZ_004400 [Myxococcota bacterium]|jgi:hypothetical protein